MVTTARGGRGRAARHAAHAAETCLTVDATDLSAHPAAFSRCIRRSAPGCAYEQCSRVRTARSRGPAARTARESRLRMPLMVSSAAAGYSSSCPPEGEEGAAGSSAGSSGVDATLPLAP